MLRIGLTGGIGSGKSTVADLFAARGVPVIDADLIARELVAPGQAALAEIVATFGGEILDEHGQLDRARLRAQIFDNAKLRTRLEAILHPRIRAEMNARVSTQTAAYVLLVIPLLFESGQRDMVDRVLVVDAPAAVQRARVAARDRQSAAQIDAILATQATRDTRLHGADDVIDNHADLQALEHQVDKLHQHYLQLAAAETTPS